jgi:hypothetical protein
MQPSCTREEGWEAARSTGEALTVLDQKDGHSGGGSSMTLLGSAQESSTYFVKMATVPMRVIQYVFDGRKDLISELRCRRM